MKAEILKGYELGLIHTECRYISYIHTHTNTHRHRKTHTHTHKHTYLDQRVANILGHFCMDYYFQTMYEQHFKI